MNNLVERLKSLADCDARAGEPLGKCMREAADTIGQMLDMLKDLRHECGLYEADASGEHYNNPELNALIERVEGDA